MRTRIWVSALVAVSVGVFAPMASASAGGGGDGDKPIVTQPATGQLPGAGPVPGGFKNWNELMRVQDRLDAAADRVTALNGSGFAGITVSAEERQLKVYWKGSAPESLEKSARLASGLSLKVSQAKHSQRELQAAAVRVARLDGVASVTPAADGSQLSVSGSAGEAVARTAVTEKAGGIPVKYETTSTPKMASRGDDWAPYWGGARWGGCSTGFGIWVGGATKVLSAGHCGSNNNNAYDGGGQLMGTISGDDNAYDRLYINASSAGRIYDGGVGSGEFSKPVVGAQRSYVGDWLCTSGSYSGARCGIRVSATNMTINIGYLVYQIVRAEQVDYTNAAGNGDSGGPVFSLSSDPNKVIAKGTLTAIDSGALVPCTGVPASASRSCSWRIYYVDVVNSLYAYNASIVTG